METDGAIAANLTRWQGPKLYDRIVENTRDHGPDGEQAEDNLNSSAE